MIGIAGSGAFGLALAVALGREGRSVGIWGRNTVELARTRRSEVRLPGVVLPESVSVLAESTSLAAAEAILLCLPMQVLRGYLAEHGHILNGRQLVACCKGIDLETLKGPSSVIASACQGSAVSVLTGPSFATDIARGLPTALTLAGGDTDLQHLLATPNLRLYLSGDVTGAELGGALKNVIAIAAGVVMGAGLGDSARAALMTRGYVEMQRFAISLGARPETLAGLSGFGDLILTCTSEQSRNYRFGQAIGRGIGFDPLITVEGAATAKAVANIAVRDRIDMPITSMVAALVAQEINLQQAIHALLSRPLKQE